MDLRSVKAVVTGGASGLGQATVTRIIAAGGRATMFDLASSKGADLAKTLGERATFTAADVTSGPAIESALTAARTAMDGVNVLVNCAGIGTAMKTVGKQGPARLEDYTRVITVNLIGTFNCIRLAAAVMATNTPTAEGERGVVINTASVAAFDGQIGQAAYSASKGGVAALTLTAARDLSAVGIRVCTIAPGLIDTPLLGTLPDDQRTVLAQSVLFPKRLGTADDFASLALELVRNHYLNGEVIRLDAGIRMPPK